MHYFVTLAILSRCHGNTIAFTVYKFVTILSRRREFLGLTFLVLPGPGTKRFWELNPVKFHGKSELLRLVP